MIDRRLLFACVLVVAAACGKKRSESSGSTVGSGSGVLTLPAGSSVSGLTVTVKPATGIAPAMQRYQLMLSQHFTVIAVVEVGPPTVALPGPSTLAITFDAKRILNGRTTADVAAVQLQKDARVADLAARVFNPTRLDVTIAEPGTVLLVQPLEHLTLIGSPAQVIRGSSAFVLKGDCSKQLGVAGPRIEALAKDPNGVVVDAEKNVKLSAKLEPAPAHPDGLTPDGVLDRGAADPGELALVLAAVWRAQGHAVQIASGQMAYEAGGKKLAGVGQWALVQLEGKPYVADTRDFSSVKLVPAAEATKQLGLTISRTCASYPPGVDARKIDWSGSTPE